MDRDVDLTFDVIAKITQACELLDEVDEYVKDLDERQSVCDMRLSDMYHLIEDAEVESWSKGELRNVTNEIKKICNIRRKVKIDSGLRKLYQDNIGKLNNKDNRAMLLERLHRGYKSYTSDYTFRIYKQEDLDKLVAPKEEPEFETEPKIIEPFIANDLE